MKCKWLRKLFLEVHNIFITTSIMLQLNSQLSWLAKGGDGHRWDGTRPAAGKVRERKRWGGWRRWCWRDGGQNRGLAGVLRVRLVGWRWSNAGGVRNTMACKSQQSSCYYSHCKASQNINWLFPISLAKKCPRLSLSSCFKCFQHPPLLISSWPFRIWPLSVSKSAGSAFVELIQRQ